MWETRTPLRQTYHHLFALIVLPVGNEVVLDECSNLGLHVYDEL